MNLRSKKVRIKTNFLVVAVMAWIVPSCAPAPVRPKAYVPPMIKSPTVNRPAPSVQVSSPMLIFGGQNKKVFLGCLNCSSSNPSSVHNQYGNFGSQYSSESIFNRYGQYGSQYSIFSPCNRYSLEAPVVVGEQGQFFGVLTMNQYAPRRITNPTVNAWLTGVCAES
jgi:hypothetical protein